VEHTQRTPLAKWNTNRDCWESLTDPADLLSGLFTVYSATFPISGSMRNGSVYARPTQVPRMDGSGSSSLPTPTARDAAASGGSTPSDVTLTDAVVRTELGSRENPRHALLKTPTSQLAVNGGSQHPEKRKAGGHGPTLADEVEHLLPTPTLQDGSNTAGPSQLVRNTVPLNTLVTLLPTPSASVTNDGEDTTSWLARRERVKATGVNGNGMGMPLTIAAQLLSSGVPTSPRSDAGSEFLDE